MGEQFYPNRKHSRMKLLFLLAEVMFFLIIVLAKECIVVRSLAVIGLVAIGIFHVVQNNIQWTRFFLTKTKK